MDSFGGFAQYERYLHYMQIIDSMDTLEGVCDAAAGQINRAGDRSTSNGVSKTNSDVEKESDDEIISEDCFQSDDDDSESEDDNPIVDVSKKKIDLDNPYRGLKDSGNPLETMSDDDFLNSYKFSKKTIYDVMELIKNGLIKHTNRGSPVPPLIELLTTIKYLTTGSVQKKAMNGVSQSTISRINTRVTKLLAALQNQFIKFPNKSEIDCNKIKFYDKGKFPDVVGCIGSTHVGVRVKGIRDYNVGYINENGYHSVRVQVHQLMLKDNERMKSYKSAIMANKKYIEGKTVMDVGAGTGVLSIFCAMAGAKKVYAVEASDVSELAESVVKENKFQNIIQVIHSKVEDVVLPDNEKVDIIVSEWMGFYLLHEGMLDSVLVARDKFLKPGGHMFPESATIYMAPCSVPSMYNFWEDIHGIKMKSLGSLIRKSDVNKPKVIQVKESQLLSEPVVLCWIDLKENTSKDLDFFKMRHVIGSNKSGYYQGMCIWFECQFPAMSGDNTECAIILCTAPKSPPTHWKQTVIVLPNELLIEKGQPIAWELSMKRSDESSRRYTLQLELLDPTKETHPMPCSCDLTKCIVIRTYLEQYPMDLEPSNSEDSLAS